MNFSTQIHERKTNPNLTIGRSLGGDLRLDNGALVPDPESGAVLVGLDGAIAEAPGIGRQHLSLILIGSSCSFTAKSMLYAHGPEMDSFQKLCNPINMDTLIFFSLSFCCPNKH